MLGRRRSNASAAGVAGDRGGNSSSSGGSLPHRPPAASASPRFSFDQLFKRMRAKSNDPRDHDQRDDGARRKLHKTKTAAVAAVAKPSLRPPPIATPPLTPAATVRLCQSPGGRANVSLAIPVTPPSAARTLHRRRCRTSSQQLQPDGGNDDDHDHDQDAAARSSFSLGSWRDSVVLSAADATVAAAAADAAAEAARPRLTAPPPRDLLPDVRALCAVASLRVARQYVAQLLRLYRFEVRATKWAAYFLELVRGARRGGALSRAAALSVRFAVVAFVRREAEARHRLQQHQEKLFQRKMTEYRVAMQCVCGTSVVKFGRKGKPHVTHLLIENGDTFKWTSHKLLSSSTKLSAKKSFPLADVVAVRAGPTTDVLARALQKGTLRLQDAKCTLSLVTRSRTFDMQARSTAEREWLLRSLAFLVALAREHEKQVAQQAELAIMKKMETLAVWKHGRKGRPHKTRLRINRYGELSWQGRSGDSIQLEEIRAIELGHATLVFQRSRRAGLTTARAATRCFSLVTRTRTLDIETASEQQRDWYVVAVRYLMDKVHEKTAAIKRDKAEKQLKMLQELCGDGEPGDVGISMAPALHT